MLASPLFLMGLSILAYSLFPLMGALGIRSMPPLLFIGFAHVVSFVTFVLLVRVRSRGGQNIRLVLQELRTNADLRLYILLDAALNLASHSLLFYAFLFVSRTNATVIFEIWPLFGMIGTSILLRDHFDTLSQRSFVLGLVAMLGLALVVWAGQAYDADPQVASEPWRGALSAMGSAVAMAISVALHVKSRLIVGNIKGITDAAIVVNIPTKACSSAFFVLLLLVFQPWERIASVGTEFWIYVVLTGAFVVSTGSAAYSEALARSKRSEIILFWYLTPLIAVFWLWLFGLDQISETLVLGGLFILSANLLLHVKADEGPAYVAVFLSLCVAGTIVHLIPSVPIRDYFPNSSLVELLSLPLGIFGILTGFVLGRQFSRRQELETVLVDVAPTLDAAGVEALEDILAEPRQYRLDRMFAALLKRLRPEQADLRKGLLTLRVKLSRPVSHGELIVLWALSLMGCVSVVFFRAKGFAGDIVTFITVPALVYLAMLISTGAGAGLGETLRRIVAPSAPTMRSRVWDRRVAGLTIVVVFLTQIVLAFERDGLTNVFLGR
ncbi:DMT family transporter [Shimia sp. R9_2]|uniref:DMT family transporter n=1 Tax=Shimia sp. R9_2 TaxID=2821112 RepID=UPI001ADB9020|nr:DMT family transporter [Shimia sp. R9_2]MBO9397435.1 DMT family transporter [Shimia sp. R9_2]